MRFRLSLQTLLDNISKPESTAYEDMFRELEARLLPCARFHCGRTPVEPVEVTNRVLLPRVLAKAAEAIRPQVMKHPDGVDADCWPELAPYLRKCVRYGFLSALRPHRKHRKNTSLVPEWVESQEDQSPYSQDSFSPEAMLLRSIELRYPVILARIFCHWAKLMGDAEQASSLARNIESIYGSLADEAEWQACGFDFALLERTLLEAGSTVWKQRFRKSDVKYRLLAHQLLGWSNREIASFFGTSLTTVSKSVSYARTTGRLTPFPWTEIIQETCRLLLSRRGESGEDQFGASQ